ncbi:hypothetical protein ACFL6M_03190 [Candidatus Eisenbacteria bacterium]|uniref:Uncharacterized protein n=1 Tax=Eiseniibacteriota bacterium TaxID=2212470 RepID=A0ABV6YK86_UNCEI
MRIAVLSSAILVLVLAGSSGDAHVPPLISYQGVLTDSLGTELDGSFDLTFRLYLVPEGPENETLWTETQSASISEGLFNVYLGDVNALDPAIFTGDLLYLGITVDTDEEMTPRLRMASAPYAITSGYVACIPQTEVCNGADDDCDNLIDEDVDCDDGLDCTLDQCVSGQCENTLVADRCLINGVCYMSGEANPLELCETCDPVLDPYGWTPMECMDDGIPCTNDDCVDGNCNTILPGMCLVDGACYTDGEMSPFSVCFVCDASNPYEWTMREGENCNDGYDCTVEDVCVDGMCVGTPVLGTCLIDGTCYFDGEQDPANECLECNSSVDWLNWTPVEDGTPCGAGGQCLSGTCVE